jgi:1,4-dihydroxy-2-naphthoyl-CoA hydrolase
MTSRTPPRPAFTHNELETSAPPLIIETRPVRFQDVDAAGTLFYPRLLDYFSDAYLALLIDAGLHGEVAHGALRTPVVHAEADYLAPLRFGDTVTVALVRARASERSFTLGFRVTRQDGAIAAIGQVTHVNIDAATFRASPLPEALRRRLEA